MKSFLLYKGIVILLRFIKQIVGDGHFQNKSNHFILLPERGERMPRAGAKGWAGEKAGLTNQRKGSPPSQPSRIGNFLFPFDEGQGPAGAKFHFNHQALAKITDTRIVWIWLNLQRGG
jgi:hypothetical protein